jgi:hypothetical protein
VLVAASSASAVAQPGASVRTNVRRASQPVVASRSRTAPPRVARAALTVDEIPEATWREVEPDEQFAALAALDESMGAAIPPYDANCDEFCLPDCGCSPDLAEVGPVLPFYAGFEAVIVKPRFSDNVALTVMEADGASFESFSERQFQYDLEFSPRVYAGWQYSQELGLRATWWQFGQVTSAVTASPPANGFGRIDPPSFGDIDISTVIPSDNFRATSDLDVYTIDLELTKQTQFLAWDLGVGFGIRYAQVEQSYTAELRDDDEVLRGRIHFRHRLEGFGPTVQLNAYRPIASDAGFFCLARGSVLFGDAQSRLEAGEDLDLGNPFRTTQTGVRDDLLSIAEVQVGFRWQSLAKRPYQPFLTVAMEGQVWNGPGSAATDQGSLGFFGFNTGMGVNW